MPDAPGAYLYGVWGSSASDVWAVGENGKLEHKVGAADWVEISTTSSETLRGVWGTGPDDVWVVGDGGTIVHRDAGGWNDVESGTTAGLRAVWGRGTDEVWAVGVGGVILFYDGGSWQPLTSDSPRTLAEVVEVGGNVWALGQYGEVLRQAGGAGAWTSMTTRLFDLDVTLHDVHGPALPTSGRSARRARWRTGTASGGRRWSATTR